MGSFDNSSVTLGHGEVLHYHEEGESEKAVILLHGLDAHSGTWRKNLQALSGPWRTIAPSLPPSHTFDGGNLVDGYSDQMRRMIAELKLTPLAVVGNSMGGWIAMRLALIIPGLVKCLVLEDAAGLVGSLEPLPLGPRLDRLGIPVLIVWGEMDDLVPLSLGRELHGIIKKSELAVVTGAGHVPHWETPEEFNSVVGSFLRRAFR